MFKEKPKSPWLKDIKIKAIDLVEKEFSGNSPPTIFVGSKYINEKKANVGILSPLDNKKESEKYDNPYLWYNENYDIKDIVNLRANLINARKISDIFDVRNNNKFLELAQEIAMSFKPTGIDVELKKKLRPKISLDNIHLPFGPSGEISSIKSNENIKLNKDVEKIFYDTDLKSIDAIRSLRDKGFQEYPISQLLSIGIMGLKHNRKLVPTRWSITATDDNLGKDYIKEIKQYNTINNYKIYYGNYLGNYYLIFMFPDVWSYELFESAMPDQLISKDQEIYTTTDFETFFGRKDYASNTVGGYYAARLSILEGLKRMKIQASCLLLRFVSSEYSVPLGVFVVRQAVRKSLCSETYTFDNKKTMLDFGRDIIIKKFGYDINNLLNKSIMIESLNKQKKLFEF